MCISMHSEDILEHDAMMARDELLRQLKDRMKGCPNDEELLLARQEWNRSSSLYVEWMDERTTSKCCTRVRQLLAQVAVAEYVLELLNGEVPMNLDSFKALYGECRQAFCSKPPFHLNLNNFEVRIGYETAVLNMHQVLERLMNLTVIDRYTSAELLEHLYTMVDVVDVNLADVSRQESVLQAT